MIIVDDKLSLDALAGRLGTSEPVATTWSFHFRLLRALRESGWGHLQRVATEVTLPIAADPPGDRLRILDPRDVTDLASEFAVRHRLNLLAAELVASAVHYRAILHLDAANVGRHWPEVMTAERVRLEVHG